MIYESIPQQVDAIQWTGDNWDEVRGALPGKVLLDFVLNYLSSHEANVSGNTPEGLLLVAGKDGAQGEVPVPVGHWLVHAPNDLTDVWPVEDAYFRAKYGPSSGEHLVLVGTHYTGLNTNWSGWDTSFDEVCAKVAERHQDKKVNHHPSEIVEVIVIRRAVVKAEISIEEIK